VAAWRIEGQYMETCNGAYLCPCITSNLTAKPSEGDCKAVIAMRIDQGEKDGVKLDGLAFIVVMHAPTVMAERNITVGLIVDERACDKQVEAISAIATGAAGGPMAALGPLVGRIAGVEKSPIRFEASGMKVSVKAGELIDQACEGIAGAVRTNEPLYVDHTAHPVNTRLALAKATRSIFNAFGIEWQDTSGTRNGHFALFAWAG